MYLPCFYTWGCLDAPTFVHPHTFVCPICLYTPRGVHTPLGPMLFCASAWFWSICMLWGLLSAFSVCWDTSLTPPLLGGASPLITSPTLSCWFPVQCYSQGYWYLMWPFPFCLGVWGAHQLFSCPYAHSCTFF